MATKNKLMTAWATAWLGDDKLDVRFIMHGGARYRRSVARYRRSVVLLVLPRAHTTYVVVDGSMVDKTNFIFYLVA